MNKTHHFRKITCFLLIFSALTSCGKIDAIWHNVSTKEPAHLITRKEANILEEEFKATRASAINTALDTIDCREYWFNLDSLQQYLYYVQKTSKKKGYEKSSLGIRIYLGAYPKKSNSVNKGLSTVLLVPTGKKEHKKNSSQTHLRFSSDTSLSDTSRGNIYDINFKNYGNGGKPPVEFKSE